MVQRQGARRSGWDPLLLVSQIVALQACHYLVLLLVTPPLMHVFTSPLAQSNSIRPSNVALIMDWRHLSGHNIPQASVPVNTPTTGKEVSPPHKLERDTPNIHPQGAPEPAQANADAEAEAEAAARAKGSINGMHQGGSTHQDEQFLRPPVTDRMSRSLRLARSWILTAAWFMASCADVAYLYFVIRRPTYILDFSLTMVFNHLVLTTYYSGTFPTSIFFWATVLLCGAIQIVWAEQLCVRREMKEGFQLGSNWKTDERAEDGPILPTSRRQRRNSAPSAVGRPIAYEEIPMVEVGK